MFMLFIWYFLLVHPFHVSVYEIVYNEESEALQISCRIFLDDLEQALRKENGNEDLDIVEDSLLAHTTNRLYMRKNFKLTVNGSPKEYNYLGGETENDVMWCYLEIENLKELKKIELKNTMLTETFEDQQNMIHFKIPGDKRSFILTEEKTSAVYSR